MLGKLARLIRTRPNLALVGGGAMLIAAVMLHHTWLAELQFPRYAGGTARNFWLRHVFERPWYRPTQRAFLGLGAFMIVAGMVDAVRSRLRSR